jgi:manganese transport protein
VVGSRWAPILFSVGVAAAGLTSAITAPLAAAFAVCGILGWSTESKTPKFRAVWIAVIVCGVLASLAVGSSPEETIVVAQAANAVALPVIAGILLLACNAKLLSRYANNAATNAIAGAVVVFVTALSIAKLVSLFY